MFSPGAPVRERLQILHLEDDPADAALIRATLANGGIACDLTLVDNGPAFEAALKSGRYDLVISDFALPSYDGARALTTALAIAPAIPFLFVSGTLGEEEAVERLKQGATDY